MVYSPRVSVVIVNWNGGKYLRDCLDSVLKTDYNDLEVIVVDNASADESKSIVKNYYPKVTLIENEKNFGFCVGNNIGIKKATGDIIVLLNNDTVVDRNWIKEILKKIERAEVGIVGCRLYFPGTNVIQVVGFKMNLLGFWETIGTGQLDRGQFDRFDCVDYVSGAAMAIKREVLNRVGLIDPIFYAYCEDMDLCYRARKAGYKVVTSNSIVYHYGSLSWDKFPIRKIYLAQRNRIYFILKHYPPRKLLRDVIEYPVVSFKIDLLRYVRKESVFQWGVSLNSRGGRFAPAQAIFSELSRLMIFAGALFLFLLNLKDYFWATKRVSN